MSIILENIDETTTVNLQNVVEENTIIIEDKSENTTIILQEGEEVFLPVTATFSASSSLVNAGEVVTFTWTSENATKVLLQGVEVPLNGSKDIVFNESEQVVFIAYNGGFQVATSEIITVVQPDDERITYANRIAEDGGEIVGFDQLEDNINAPVGRKEGKLYAKSGDDYSVVANGERYEFAREGFYRKVAANVPRFDWSNGIQELLVQGQATNIIPYSWDFNQWVNSNTLISSDADSLFFNDSFKIEMAAFNSSLQYFVSSLDNSVSLIVKNIDSDNFRISGVGNNGFTIYFNLMTLTHNVNAGIITNISIANIYNDWINITFDFEGDINTIRLYPSFANIGQAVLISNFEIGENVGGSPILTNGIIVTRPSDIITNSQGQLAIGRYDSV